MHVKLTAAASSSDEERADKESKVTMSYRSKEKPEMEGPKDMGATLTLQIDSEVKVRAVQVTRQKNKPNQV